MMQVWLLDDNNFFTGKSVMVEKVEENMTTIPITFGYIKPFFTGEEWIEGATEEEIKQWEMSQPGYKDLSDKIEDLISELSSYKHEYIKFIEFDGCTQRTLLEDRIMMLDCQQSLELKDKNEIIWKYPEKYITVKDPEYFINMRLNVSTAIEKTFNTERILIDEIKKLTEDNIDSYNMKNRFKEIFESL